MIIAFHNECAAERPGWKYWCVLSPVAAIASFFNARNRCTIDTAGLRPPPQWRIFDRIVTTSLPQTAPAYWSPVNIGFRKWEPQYEGGSGFIDQVISS